MDTQNILTKLNATIKAITRSDIGSSLLTPQKAQQFIRVVENSTPLLRSARRLDMNSHTREIDRVMFAGRILKKTGGEQKDISNEQKVTTAVNKLTSEELGGFVGLTDHTLEDNIERGKFEDTVLQLLGEASGRDLEYLYLAGDKSSPDELLSITDGWLKKSANRVTGVATAPNAGQFVNVEVESLLKKMLDACPKKYLTDLTQWRYYVTWDILDDYREKLGLRETALGDAAKTGAIELSYKGIKLEYVPQMPMGSALLAPPSNLVYGLYRDIKVEPDRVPKARRTDFVITTRTDCHFEDENASVVASGYGGE
ncbi:hypothetical protein J2Z48_002657 [Croceifilum oryzae]|uniref:Phage major capsid protein n=1 Tax=Croceifilum oryzae TaxID=1553429 RepID=A0AAJ1WT66_9BACL|nr:phage major capsid protein [Croceifilum oryzae]MDQ0418465.1 hypothetical protein [Croceifilum oryzae]